MILSFITEVLILVITELNLYIYISHPAVECAVGCVAVGCVAVGCVVGCVAAGCIAVGCVAVGCVVGCVAAGCIAVGCVVPVV